MENRSKVEFVCRKVEVLDISGGCWKMKLHLLQLLIFSVSRKQLKRSFLGQMNFSDRVIFWRSRSLFMILIEVRVVPEFFELPAKLLVEVRVELLLELRFELFLEVFFLVGLSFKEDVRVNEFLLESSLFLELFEFETPVTSEDLHFSKVLLTRTFGGPVPELVVRSTPRCG